MARILVVHYSRTGATKRAATDIAAKLGADLEEIKDHTHRTGLVGYLRSAFEGATQKVTQIDRVVHDPSAYDIVVIGSPVWNMSLSSPVRTFIRQHRMHLKNVAFFCTCGSSGGDRALRQMTRETGRVPLAVLVLTQADASSGVPAPALGTFVDRIRQEMKARGRTDGAGVVQPAAPAE